MVSKNCEGCEIYTACHSYTGAGRRYKIPGSEREDFITHSKQQAASASCLHCVPLPPCPTGMRSSNAGRRYSCVAAQKLRASGTIIFERGPQQICPIFAQRKTLYNLVQERKKRQSSPPEGNTIFVFQGWLLQKFPWKKIVQNKLHQCLFTRHEETLKSQLLLLLSNTQPCKIWYVHFHNYTSTIL